ncbi:MULTISPECIES: hypothetical protein [Clostridium]|nr:hypothetical protein [Clostridium cadaveris]MDU4953838.1 hypothetical protein [Clostridium sp.]
MGKSIKIKSSNKKRKDRVLIIIQEDTEEGQYRFAIKEVSKWLR